MCKKIVYSSGFTNAAKLKHKRSLSQQSMVQVSNDGKLMENSGHSKHNELAIISKASVAMAACLYLPMDVEQNFACSEHHCLEAEMSGSRSKGKMKATEDEEIPLVLPLSTGGEERIHGVGAIRTSMADSGMIEDG